VEAPVKRVDQIEDRHKNSRCRD